VEREEQRVKRHLETLAVESTEVEAERAETHQRLEELERSLGAARETEERLDREMTELGPSSPAAGRPRPRWSVM